MSEQPDHEAHVPAEELSDFGAALSDLMPRLASYARSLTRNPDAAQDLVQDTVLKASEIELAGEQATLSA